MVGSLIHLYVSLNFMTLYLLQQRGIQKQTLTTKSHKPHLTRVALEDAETPSALVCKAQKSPALPSRNLVPDHLMSSYVCSI